MDLSAHTQRGRSAPNPQIASLGAEGSASHSYFSDLVGGSANEGAPDIADISHYLCQLHGHFPGVLDHAAARTTDTEHRRWLAQAASAFANERAQMTKLTVLAGPTSSTPGQDESNAAIRQLRNSLDLLAQSERAGSAQGTAIMLVADWADIRRLLVRIGTRLGMEFVPSMLPSRDTVLTLFEEIETRTGHGRAMRFGATQLLAQHRAFWDLMEARADARHAGERFSTQNGPAAIRAQFL